MNWRKVARSFFKWSFVFFIATFASSWLPKDWNMYAFIVTVTLFVTTSLSNLA
ncbi:MAG TPA: hypothetical protein VJJ22_03665 [Candidatus Paceibacterota bacterium]